MEDMYGTCISWLHFGSLNSWHISFCKTMAKLNFIFFSWIMTIHFHDITNDVNKKDRPNTTPTVRAICTFAVYFSVFRPFFSLHSCL